MPLYEDAKFESGRAAQIGANRVKKCVSLNVRLILLILSGKSTTFFRNIQVVGYVFFIFFSGFVH